MADVEPKTTNKTGASGAAWSEAEKIAYLIVLCENEGRVDAKIASAPIPAGRSIVSCKKMLQRLKEKHRDDIEKIKAGQVLTAAPASDAGETVATPDKKPKTPRKRKSKVDMEAKPEESPKKKAAGRKKKGDASPVHDAAAGNVKEENVEDDAMEV